MTMKERPDAQCPWTVEMETLGVSEPEEITELVKICQEFFPTIETSGDCLFCNADHDGPLGEPIPIQMHERHCQLARLRQWLDDRGLLGLPHAPLTSSSSARRAKPSSPKGSSTGPATRFRLT